MTIGHFDPAKPKNQVLRDPMKTSDGIRSFAGPDDGDRQSDRRSSADRRRRRPPGLRSLLFGGRRETIRRGEDRQTAFYLDRYRQSLFGVILCIMLLSVVDAVLTMILISHGAVEINPVMAFYLEMGPRVFLSVKYALTGIGVLVLLLCRNYMLKSLRIRAGAFIYVALAAFIGVVTWQLYLFGKHVI